MPISAHLPERVRILAEGFAEASTATPAELRRAILARAASMVRGTALTPVPADVERYVDQVISAAYGVTDAHIESLKKAGYDEDAIIDITEAAALGASLSRFEVALEAIGDG